MPSNYGLRNREYFKFVQQRAEVQPPAEGRLVRDRVIHSINKSTHLRRLRGVVASLNQPDVAKIGIQVQGSPLRYIPQVERAPPVSKQQPRSNPYNIPREWILPAKNIEETLSHRLGKKLSSTADLKELPRTIRLYFGVQTPKFHTKFAQSQLAGVQELSPHDRTVDWLKFGLE